MTHEFKVGDKVRIIGYQSSTDKPIGSIGDVVGINEGFPPIRVDFRDDHWWYDAENIELIAEAPLESQVPEFVIGDTARLLTFDTELTDRFYEVDLTVGDEYEVVGVGDDHVAILDDANDMNTLYFDQIEKVLAQEHVVSSLTVDVADLETDLFDEVTEPEGLDGILAERGSRYGKFKEHARITQNIKRAMHDSPNWDSLPDYMKESLEMNAHKVGRILNGDPMYDDSWVDIGGYAELVVKEINGEGV